MASSYVKQCQQIVREYRLAGGPWPARRADIAEWAIANGKWQVPRASKVRMCGEDLAAAMALETITDNTGRRVRLKHATQMKVDGVQGSFWGDIRTMSLNEMRLNSGQRRRGVLAELVQITHDLRFFNELHPEWEQVCLALDFTADVREIEQDYEKQPTRAA